MHNIFSCSLEKANTRLLEDLRHAEIEYNSLQDEVRVLNDRLINFRNEHVLELGKTFSIDSVYQSASFSAAKFQTLYDSILPQLGREIYGKISVHLSYTIIIQTLVALCMQCTRTIYLVSIFPEISLLCLPGD